jgi:hypothetical protein
MKVKEKESEGIARQCVARLYSRVQAATIRYNVGYFRTLACGLRTHAIDCNASQRLEQLKVRLWVLKAAFFLKMNGRTSRDPTGPERKLQSAAIAKLAELRKARSERATRISSTDLTQTSGSVESGRSRDSFGEISSSEEGSCFERSSQEVPVKAGTKKPSLKDTCQTGANEISFQRLQKGGKMHKEHALLERPRSPGASTSVLATIQNKSTSQLDMHEFKSMHSSMLGDESKVLDGIINNLGSMSLGVDDQKENDRASVPSHAKNRLNSEDTQRFPRASESVPAVSTSAQPIGRPPGSTTTTSASTIPQVNAEGSDARRDLNLEGKERAFCLPGSVASSLYDHQVQTLSYGDPAFFCCAH